MAITSRRMLWTTIALLIAVGLVRAGQWLATEPSTRDPDLVIIEALTNPRPNPATAAVLLKEMVVREMSLRTPDLTEWDVVDRIRDWAYAHTVWSTESYLLDRNANFNYYQRSAPEIFAAFLSDKGGVWCGGTAHALMKLYRMFGFSASTLDYGRPDIADHVVTLVRITYKGRKKLVVQDSTFNITYTTTGGIPYDYFDLLAVLMRGEHERIAMPAGKSGMRGLLVHPREGSALLRDARGSAQIVKGGGRKYQFAPTLEGFEREHGAAIHAFLRNEGRPADMRYLLLYPTGGSDPSIVEKAREIAKAQ